MKIKKHSREDMVKLYDDILSFEDLIEQFLISK